MTRMSTLIAVIVNMLGFDSSVPIHCQVRIIFPGFSYARADLNYLGQGMDYIWNREPFLIYEDDG